MHHTAANQSPPPSDEPPAIEHGAPRRILGLRQAIVLIVGVVIGAGIFKAPSLVAAMTGDAAWMFGAWFFGGVMSLIGALCYAELSMAYAHAGGDYHFLRRAYGRSISFLFGWSRFAVITTGSIALLAFVFGDYMNQVLPLNVAGANSGAIVYAIAIVLILSWANLRNIHTGIATQSWLTVFEVSGLLLIAGTAAVLFGLSPSDIASAVPKATPSIAPSASAFGLAMVFVLLTYGGWNEAAYISAEMKGGRHNIVKALTLSILIITVLYLLVTWAFWKVLGLQGMAGSDAIAADLMRIAFGPVGEKIISVLVAISAITSINATMIFGARTSYAMGRDWPILRKLGVWDTARDIPANAMWIQSGASMLLVMLGALIGGGFKSMVEFTAPVFWLFFLLSGISLFLLRIRDPDTPRPYKVPLYPLLPICFCLSCAYMLWSSLSYVYDQSLGGINAAWIGVFVLIVGIVLLVLMRGMKSRKEHADVSP